MTSPAHPPATNTSVEETLPVSEDAGGVPTSPSVDPLLRLVRLLAATLTVEEMRSLCTVLYPDMSFGSDTSPFGVANDMVLGLDRRGGVPASVLHRIAGHLAMTEPTAVDELYRIAAELEPPVPRPRTLKRGAILERPGEVPPMMTGTVLAAWVGVVVARRTDLFHGDFWGSAFTAWAAVGTVIWTLIYVAPSRRLTMTRELRLVADRLRGLNAGTLLELGRGVLERVYGPEPRAWRARGVSASLTLLVFFVGCIWGSTFPIGPAESMGAPSPSVSVTGTVAMAMLNAWFLPLNLVSDYLCMVSTHRLAARLQQRATSWRLLGGLAVNAGLVVAAAVGPTMLTIACWLACLMVPVALMSILAGAVGAITGRS